MESEKKLYFENEDGSYKTYMLQSGITELFKYTTAEIYKAIMEYKWIEEDVLLCNFDKCGTHLVWEITQMLLNGSSEYLTLPKEAAMIDLFPVTQTADLLPSPKAINTHYRLDVLPREFQNHKTIVVIRNPKDVMVSNYHHIEGLEKVVQLKNPDMELLTLEKYAEIFINTPVDNRCFFRFYEHMWKIRNERNILFLFYEDIVKDPLNEVKKMDNFLGTGRSESLLKEIAEASSFDKMKQAKAESERVADDFLVDEELVEQMDNNKLRFTLYRKGKIGGWKDHLTVAMNEKFDKFIDEWKTRNGLEDLQFTFE